MSSNKQKGAGGGGGGLLGGVLEPVTDTVGGVGQGLGKALSNIGGSSIREYDPADISPYRQQMEQQGPPQSHGGAVEERLSQMEHKIEQILQYIQQQQQQR
jgi:hypothetical protein